MGVLNGLSADDDTADSALAKELSQILEKESMEGLLYTHDRIAGFRIDSGGPQFLEDDALLRRLGNYSEPNIKIVRIEKTNEPLGATVKNEDDAVVVGRIIRGGTAEASGLLHEGDEVLEVNEVPLRGKNVNEVCDILSRMQGTLTLLVVPTRQHVGSGGQNDHQDNSVSSSPSSVAVMHVKAHIDYDPEDDPYLPCRELGISFKKGEVMHVINQKDPHWWQARREGEDDSQLPGLIPSASFQQQREAVKHTIAAQDAEDKHDVRGKKGTTGFLCARRGGKNKKKGGGGSKAPVTPAQPYALDEENDAGTGENGETITYEEVALYYPRSDRKRPVVLIGPPNIGRHELRQRLMQDGDRFAAAIPRKFFLNCSHILPVLLFLGQVPCKVFIFAKV
jgi:MAGUK p55 subfamily protein 5